MNRRAFRVGSWLALAAAVVTAAMAVIAGVIGVLVLTDRADYPADYDLGPFHVSSTLSVEVVTASPVCQPFDIGSSANEFPGDGSFCYKIVQDSGEQIIDDGVVSQDPHLQATEAVLSGELHLATSDVGWNPWVAGQAVKQVIVGATITAWLVLLWRLLAAAAGGHAFSARTVRLVRALGWLTIAAAVLAPALNVFTDFYRLDGLHLPGYGSPVPQPVGSWGYPGGVDFVQVGLGVLVLLVAEVFRHGAAIEEERRLTV